MSSVRDDGRLVTDGGFLRLVHQHAVINDDDLEFAHSLKADLKVGLYASNLRFESPAREEIHRERRGERGDLDQVPRLLTDLSPQLHPLAVTADGIDQSAHDRPPDTGPIRDLFDQIRA